MPFTFTEDTFSSWNGIGEENCTGASYLGILAIGWCYVLSAQLVETQGEKASIQYTNSKAGYNNEGFTHVPSKYAKARSRTGFKG